MASSKAHWLKFYACAHNEERSVYSSRGRSTCSGRISRYRDRLDDGFEYEFHICDKHLSDFQGEYDDAELLGVTEV
jgi:hypothetical protein